LRVPRRNAIRPSEEKIASASLHAGYRANRPSANCSPNEESCRLHNSAADDAAYETSLPSRLYVEVPNIQRVIFDELAPRLDHVAHENGEHFVCVDGVILVQVDLQQFALLGIHGGLEQLFGVHLAETFETFDLHAPPANLQNLLQDFWNGKQRMRNRFL